MLSKKNKPLISIGLPVYNGENTIERTLDGIKKQTFKDFEVLISDDCSNDRTAEICHAYCKKDLRFHYIKQKTNLGWTGNLGYLFKISNAPYFVCLSHDDYYANDNYLESLYERAKEGYDFVYPNVKKIIKSHNNKFIELSKKNSKFNNSKSTFEKHLTLVKKHYIGYQIFGLMNKEKIMDCFGLLFRNYYYEKESRNYLDEEPFLHFVFSRYKTYFEQKIYYVKDMSNSMYYRMNTLESFMPIFWNTLACIGILAEAPYTNIQRLKIIFFRILRGVYMMLDLVIKDVKVFLRFTVVASK